ncbi:winged helix-turn-helix transcriptional regulator [Limnoglobus roseus]|uniref:Transcriptional regulator n=1 Tax=Limnoglobus roseus TaxID=2598579 RepID=A0A5C1ACN4_9BACT|nr:helix-turn-helix domain-containing protein [Limnoglobus roseus]QEL16385.1 transcriptional regulator [Limnoglobus roseus]
MKRTSFAGDTCPVARAVDVVGDWWSLLIVRDAFIGRRRFGEFEKGLGVAKNILTDRLRKLVAAGVLETIPAADGSAYKEYALTNRGRGLLPVVVALGQWAACEDSGFALVDAKKGKPARLEFRSEDGRKLDPNDVRLVPPAAD